MITRFETIPDTLVSAKMLFEEAVIPNRITPLFGPNGAGKTTLLDALSVTLNALQTYERLSCKAADAEEEAYYKEEMARKIQREGLILQTDGKPFRVLHYCNSRDNFRSRQARTVAESYDPYLLNARWDAKSLSEGQSIVYSVYDLFDLMGTSKDALYVDGGGDLIVLIDELDSGLSIDNLDMFMRKLRRIGQQRKDVQVIFSFNNPRVLRYFPDCLSLYDGRPVHLKSDDDMLAQIKAHEKGFNRKRKKSNGRPKVYA